MLGNLAALQQEGSSGMQKQRARSLIDPFCIESSVIGIMYFFPTQREKTCRAFSHIRIKRSEELTTDRRALEFCIFEIAHANYVGMH